MSDDEMRIYTWNVNGYNSIIHRAVVNLLNDEQIDVLFLTEIKCKSETIKEIDGYSLIVNSNIPANYHGVAMFINNKIKYEQISNILNIYARHDTKARDASVGRVISIKINDLYIVGVYSPNSGVNGLKNIKYRIEIWDKGLADYLNSLGDNVLLIGDLNIALDRFDVSDPNIMKSWPGYTDKERESFKETYTNFIDVYRKFDPTGRIYTWIGTDPRPNYGMRLDHIMVNSQNIYNKINSLLFCQEITISDHIPIGVEISK